VTHTQPISVPFSSGAADAMSVGTASDAVAVVCKHAQSAFSSTSPLTEEDLMATRIVGGVANVNYRVRLRDSEEMGAVVRFRPRAKDDPERRTFFNQFAIYVGGGKSAEAHGLRAAGAEGLAPELLYYSEGGDVMITKELNGRPLTQADLKDPARLEKVLAAVVRLHKIKVDEKDMPYPTREWGYRVLPVINYTLDYMRKQGYAKTLPEDMPQILSDLERWDTLIADSVDVEQCKHSGYSAVGHTDPVPANILECADGSIAFVDFEYSSRCHPDYDVGKLAAAAMFSRSEDAVCHEIWSRCGGGFGDGSRVGSSLARYHGLKIFEIAFRALCCAVNAYESSLPFKASWSTATTWGDARDLLFDEVREKMASPEMQIHQKNLAGTSGTRGAPEAAEEGGGKRQKIA